MKYYVYLHVTEKTGELFYVGKGSGKRHRSKSRRSKAWRDIVSKNGFLSFIIAYFDDEKESLIFESKLIDILGYEKYGTGILANLPTHPYDYSDPRYHVAHKSGCRKRSDTQSWKENQREGSINRSKNPEWIKNTKVGAKKRFSDPEYLEKMRAGWRRRSDDPEYRKKLSDSLKESHRRRKEKQQINKDQ